MLILSGRFRVELFYPFILTGVTRHNPLRYQIWHENDTNTKNTTRMSSLGMGLLTIELYSGIIVMFFFMCVIMFSTQYFLIWKISTVQRCKCIYSCAIIPFILACFTIMFIFLFDAWIIVCNFTWWYYEIFSTCCIIVLLFHLLIICCDLLYVSIILLMSCSSYYCQVILVLFISDFYLCFFFTIFFDFVVYFYSFCLEILGLQYDWCMILILP